MLRSWFSNNVPVKSFLKKARPPEKADGPDWRPRPRTGTLCLHLQRARIRPILRYFFSMSRRRSGEIGRLRASNCRRHSVHRSAGRPAPGPGPPRRSPQPTQNRGPPRDARRAARMSASLRPCEQAGPQLFRPPRRSITSNLEPQCRQIRCAVFSTAAAPCEPQQRSWSLWISALIKKPSRTICGPYSRFVPTIESVCPFFDGGGSKFVKKNACLGIRSLRQGFCIILPP
jgi:hypothetical protein